MGHVFEAWDGELERPVAIKVLDRVDREALAAARHEARCLARLVHPNVVAVHEVGEARLEGLDAPDADPRAYLAMELIEGEPLRARRGDWRSTLDSLLAAGRGLAAVHEAGLVHGDFKTGNLLVGRDGVVRVIDFGLAGAPGEGSLARAGTVPFMAPERLEGGAADALGDQWSFCVTAWELLMGALPFGARSPEQVLAAIGSGRLARGRRAPGLPRAVEAVVRRGLAERAQDRYASMLVLLAALERAAERGHRVRVGLSIAVVALGLAAAILAAALGWGRASAGPTHAQMHSDSAWLVGPSDHELARLDAARRLPSPTLRARVRLELDRGQARRWIDQGELALASELLRDALARAELTEADVARSRLALRFERLRLHARSEAPSLDAVRDDGLVALRLAEQTQSATLLLAWAQLYGEALARVDLEAALDLLEPTLARVVTHAPLSPQRLALELDVAALHDRAGRHERAWPHWQRALTCAEALHGPHSGATIPVVRGMIHNAAARHDAGLGRELLERLEQLGGCEGRALGRSLRGELGLHLR